MTVHLAKPGRGSVPIHATDREQFAAHTAALDPAARRWLQTTGFDGAPDTHALLPAADGRLAAVWAGVHGAAHPWALAALPKALPAGRYHLGDAGLALDADRRRAVVGTGQLQLRPLQGAAPRAGAAAPGARRGGAARPAAGHRHRVDARPRQHAGRAHGPGRAGRGRAAGGAPARRHASSRPSATSCWRPASRPSTPWAARPRARRG